MTRVLGTIKIPEKNGWIELEGGSITIHRIKVRIDFKEQTIEFLEEASS